MLLSRTAVSELGARLWDDYQAFAKRDLSEYELAYLFVDGIAERLRPGAKREPVLAAWGYTVDGRRVLLWIRKLPAAGDCSTPLITNWLEVRVQSCANPEFPVSAAHPRFSAIGAGVMARSRSLRETKTVRKRIGALRLWRPKSVSWCAVKAWPETRFACVKAELEARLLAYAGKPVVGVTEAPTMPGYLVGGATFPLSGRSPADAPENRPARGEGRVTRRAAPSSPLNHVG